MDRFLKREQNARRYYQTSEEPEMVGHRLSTKWEVAAYEKLAAGLLLT